MTDSERSHIAITQTGAKFFYRKILIHGEPEEEEAQYLETRIKVGCPNWGNIFLPKNFDDEKRRKKGQIFSQYTGANFSTEKFDLKKKRGTTLTTAAT